MHNALQRRNSISRMGPLSTALALAQISTTLHSFDGSGGSEPYAGLVQGTDGDFYGTTYQGGTNDCGTVFKLKQSGAATSLTNSLTNKENI